MPSPLSKQRESPLGKQLSSPRGSPRGAPRDGHCLRLTSRHISVVLMCCLPLVIILQSSITFISSNSSDIHNPDFSTLGTLEAPRPKSPHQPLPAVNKPLSESSFSYTNYPILPHTIYTPHSSNPLPVILLGSDKTQNPEHGLLLDGLERSRYVSVIRNETNWKSLPDETPNQTVVHMVDWAALERDCHLLEAMYDNLAQPPSHLLVYFDTTDSARITSCPKVNRLFRDRFRIMKRSIVKGRHWNSPKQWITKGKIMENSVQGAGPVLHAPHFLREPFVELVSQALHASGTDLSQIVTRRRQLDVTHVWRKGDSSHYGRLRRQVSLVIQKLNGTRLKSHSLRWLVRPQGDDVKIIKGVIQKEYVANLLNSKIVVVAQRDEWEDHYRLLESMASGALVLTDEMLAAPHGLRNGTNVLTYHDAKNLRDLILYYAHPDNEKERLTIAQRGFDLAMGKHRSWHRMEQILFGAARSKVDKPLEGAPSRRRRRKLS